MSLIHEALEKAKRERSRQNELPEYGVKKSKLKKRRKTYLLVFLLLSIFIFYMTYSLWPLSSSLTLFHKSSLHQSPLKANNEPDSSVPMVQNSVKEGANANFGETYKMLMLAGDMSGIVNLCFAFPDSVSMDIAKEIIDKLIALDDFYNLERVLNLLETKALIYSPQFLKLAEYYEKKGSLKSASFYIREYLNGNLNPILLAKAATIYDRFGIWDSALKYYGSFMMKVDTGDFYFQIKRRYDYLAKGREEAR
ncbi:MAG: hypothetical protein ACPLN0_00750 [Candidatus Hydrothermia bacterium]